MFLIHWSPAHDNALEELTNYLGILGRSSNTARAYVGGARDFLQHTKKDLDELSESDVFEYLVYLKEQRGLANDSLNQRRAALRMLFEDILGRPLSRKVLKFAKRPKRLPETLTTSEVTGLLQAAENFKHQTILMTIYSAGLRVGEAIRLKPLDIDSKSMQIHIRGAKGQKDRQVMLSEKLLVQLRQYWRIHRPKGGSFQAPILKVTSILRPFRRHSRKPHSKQEFASRSLYIACGIALLLICSRLVWVCPISNNCSVTARSRRPWSTSRLHRKALASPVLSTGLPSDIADERLSARSREYLPRIR